MPTAQNNPDLPPRPLVVRGSEAPACRLSPTNRFTFPFPSHAAQPEIYLESAGAGDGPPLHRHGWATWELVLEGRVRFQIDGEEHRLAAGDCIYTPPGAAHAYVVESERARVVGINQAGGRLRNLQTRAEPLFAAEGGPAMSEVMRIAAEEGVEVLGPPLPTSTAPEPPR